MWEKIAETPWWFYLFFFWFFQLAFHGTKPKIISSKVFIFLPLIATSLLVVSCSFLINFNLQNIFILLAGICIGSGLGFTQFYFRKIKAVKNKSQFYVPGSWKIIFILFCVAAIKLYYFNTNFIDSVYNYLNAAIMRQSIMFVILAGIALGLFIGRTSYLIRCLRSGPFVE